MIILKRRGKGRYKRIKIIRNISIKFTQSQAHGLKFTFKHWNLIKKNNKYTKT